MYGGDGIDFQYMYGDGGDDWLKGGDNFSDVQRIYGDSDEYGKTGGDDVIYGGSNGTGQTQELIGGKGNDKIFSGSNMEYERKGMDEGRVTIFGDYEDTSCSESCDSSDS